MISFEAGVCSDDERVMKAPSSSSSSAVGLCLYDMSRAVVYKSFSSYTKINAVLFSVFYFTQKLCRFVSNTLNFEV